MILSRGKILFGLLFSLSVLFTPGIGSAASEIGLQSGDIEVETIPENPEPYQDVTINLTSFATDLNKATIVWQSGGRTVLSGIGRTSYSFKALGPNITITLDVSITPPNSTDKVTKRISINPSEIDILWEGIDSYTPPFYKGKSFVSSGGMIKVVALPTTSTSGRTNATYSWKNNDNAVLNASGYNKDSYIFVNDELNTRENISVTASTVNGSYNATKNLNIPIVNPKIIFYKKSPTEGVLYNKALINETFISEDEFTLVAVPYFLSLKGNENDFSYKWQINGEGIETPSRKTELTVRPSSKGGYATISLVLENLNAFFQKASGQIKINL
ncbi:MAG: hypothetical protein AAB477_00265 [Patescibacteria group bacterium]